jgi:predicted permease
MGFEIEGKPVADHSQRPNAGFNMVTPDYFKTFGIRITRGRGFTDADTATNMPVAIVNSEMVRKYFPDVDPLTQRLVIDKLIPGVTDVGASVSWQIVGVYEKVRNGGPQSEGFTEVDVPFAQSPWPGVSMAVRTAAEPDGMTNSIAAAIRTMDPDLPMADVKSMDHLLEESVGDQRFGAALFGGFALIALVLAAFGIYGVMSFAVAQRTREIGLRMALGAGEGQVMKLILKEGMTLGIIGLLIGLLGAYAIGRLMKSMLYGIGSIDGVAFSAVATILLFSALIACYIPPRHPCRSHGRPPRPVASSTRRKLRR